MPYTAKIAYGGNNYFYIDSTETYSECVQQIVKLLNDPITSFDSLEVTILKGHPLAWMESALVPSERKNWREEHFNLTPWILRKEGKLV